MIPTTFAFSIKGVALNIQAPYASSWCARAEESRQTSLAFDACITRVWLYCARAPSLWCLHACTTRTWLPRSLSCNECMEVAEHALTRQAPRAPQARARRLLTAPACVGGVQWGGGESSLLRLGRQQRQAVHARVARWRQHKRRVWRGESSSIHQHLCKEVNGTSLLSTSFQPSCSTWHRQHAQPQVLQAAVMLKKAAQIAIDILFGEIRCGVQPA